jgi:hypothetical protein
LRRLPFREAALLFFYHLRLLNWWLFLLTLLGFLAAGLLTWLQLHLAGAQAESLALDLARFVLESVTGLCAGMLASSLLVGDPALEVTMATRQGVSSVVSWRAILTFALLLCCSTLYLAWSLASGVNYASQQLPLALLLLWLAPVLLMGALGLFGALATGNAALGTVIAALPLAGAHFLHSYLIPIAAAHPFFLPYTSWNADATDWWTNRLALILMALALAGCNWWWLRHEEGLLNDAR